MSHEMKINIIPVLEPCALYFESEDDYDPEKFLKAKGYVILAAQKRGDVKPPFPIGMSAIHFGWFHAQVSEPAFNVVMEPGSKDTVEVKSSAAPEIKILVAFRFDATPLSRPIFPAPDDTSRYRQESKVRGHIFLTEETYLLLTSEYNIVWEKTTMTFESDM